MKLIPPLAALALMAKAIAGVGVARSVSSGRRPFTEIKRAASSANISAMNLVSYPTMTSEPGARWVIQFDIA